MSEKLTRHETEVLFSDFSDNQVYDRETVEKYSRNTRGSVRLATGRYYTPSEMEERARLAFSVDL